MRELFQIFFPTKAILIDLIEGCTTHGNLAPLLLRFYYHSENSSASMHEIMERRNYRVTELYSRRRFDNGNVTLDAKGEYLFDD